MSSRFSSGDLSGEYDDEPNASTGLAPVGRQDSTNYQGTADRPLQTQPQPMVPPSQPVPGAPPPGGDLSLNLRPSSKTTSAPSSPAKTRESLLQRVQSLTGAARDQVIFNFYIYIFDNSCTFSKFLVTIPMRRFYHANFYKDRTLFYVPINETVLQKKCLIVLEASLTSNIP